ncbi:hypothetical protein Pla175_09520 [Pirellulimonas nuda]|uniref:Uncharacterized protein n=1 Tax=Pirellulimonas nuda TaxID=2528009 RepID=A0A518D7X5_9BACT|nr:hypothetical protein [Pirellulimonas nuda]QDU87587.1 hypothetical protein Pla175_09520 [Pirellulimonas nuda]
MNDDPLEQQQAMVESSLGLVFQTLDDAVAEGVSQPVVWLVDCEDEVGGAIARGWLGDEAVDDALAEADEEDATLFARAIAWDDCRREAPEVFPYLAPVFDQPPTEGVLVIGVTAGGASALVAPPDARP